MNQWFTPKEVAEKQKACPMSIGQAEAGRYTYCVGEVCMAWKWNPEQIETNDIKEGVNPDKVPEGWQAICEPYASGKKMVVDIMKKPTHGRCGMVP